ncbi:MAG: DUF2244 domain-containing protein [Pseudomonadota bacterium]
MPYAWTTELAPSGAEDRLTLWPYRSLSRRGFVIFILVTAGMISLPLLSVLGTVVLWGILPFFVLAVGGVWFAIQRSYRDADMGEELTINPGAVHLVRRNVRGPAQTWECESYWAKVHMHPTGGPVPHYVTLTGHGREVEIGAFLSEDERKRLYGEICEALQRATHPAPEPLL